VTTHLYEGLQGFAFIQYETADAANAAIAAMNGFTVAGALMLLAGRTLAPITTAMLLCCSFIVNSMWCMALAGRPIKVNRPTTAMMGVYK
jgi:hypothetical protein